MFNGCCKVILYYRFFISEFGVQDISVMQLFYTSVALKTVHNNHHSMGICNYDDKWEAVVRDESHFIYDSVVINSRKYKGSVHCGMCLLLQNSDKNIKPMLVYIQDICPECAEDSIQFAGNNRSKDVFVAIAAQCPVRNAIQYRFDYTSFNTTKQMLLRFQILNSRIPIVEVKVQRYGKWIDFNLDSDNYWECEDGIRFGSGLTLLRMKAANGQYLEDIIPRIKWDEIMKGEDLVQVELDYDIIPELEYYKDTAQMHTTSVSIVTFVGVVVALARSAVS